MPHIKDKLKHRIPRITAVIDLHGNCGHSILRGIFAHIVATSEWGLEVIRSAEKFTAATIQYAIEHKTDGMLIMLDAWESSTLKALIESRIPFVTVDMPIPKGTKTPARYGNIEIDNIRIGQEAAEEFIRQGRYACFAYVPTVTNSEWSQLRQEGFADRVQKTQGSFAYFPSSQYADGIARRGFLSKWLRKLEKPAAILAADDSVAVEVIQAAKVANLAIPGKLAVLGVDNDVLLCESIRPNISSILPDFFGAGRRAAELLQSIIDKGKRPRKSQITNYCQTNEIIHRQSTTRQFYAGALVQKAIGYINNNAKYGITANDVQHHLNVSRSLLDHRIREVANTTLQTLITEARLTELRKLLKSSAKPIGEITRQLGWQSPNYPKNLFKRHYGITMRSWRSSWA